MQPPPILPDRSLKRVLAIARGDGWSVVIIASLGGFCSLVTGSWFATGASVLVVLAGAGELHGRRLLLNREPRGLRWLIGAQMCLLVVIWAYAACRWWFFDPAALWMELPAPARAEIDRQLLTAGMQVELDRPLFLQVMNALVCLLLLILTFFYQGGMALYYTLKRRAVTEVLKTQPPPLSQRAQTISHKKAEEATKWSP
ncbi:MAG: hypothetical protein QG602_811 [Verrucomicrobiota bacterium]|nr:hypothetical protein [Verrucomicrobiota bacterium]